MWLTTGTVSTSLDHPTSGKTQLFRPNGPDYELLERIFENPRVHTDKGYQEKKKAKKQEPVIREECIGICIAETISTECL